MRIRGRIGTQPAIPQASLADVAFLLLIFFIATTMFDADLGLPLVLPGARAKALTIERKDLISLRSDQAGSIYLDDQPIAIEEIRPRLEERLAAHPNTVVSIETHPRARYGVMVSVLDEVRKAHATRISLRLQRPEGGGAPAASPAAPPGAPTGAP